MAKNKSKSLPRFRSLDELVEFFETHDLGEYWNEMPEANFEVDIKRRTHLFALEAELASKLTEIAKSRKISSEALINTWLREKIQERRRKMPKCRICGNDFKPLELAKLFPSEVEIGGEKFGNPLEEICPKCGVKVFSSVAQIAVSFLEALRKQREIGFK
jgi:hypothetical protein